MQKIRLQRGIRYDSALRRIVHKENRFRKVQPDVNALPKVSILLRCDVEGTLEAILDVLQSYYSQLAELDIIDFDVGVPTDSNVTVAKEFNGLINFFLIY